MILYLLIVVGFAQFGPSSRQICHDNADRLNALLQRAPDCQWVELPAPTPPNRPAKPTVYTPLGSGRGTCDGNFECSSPYPEANQLYRMMDYACLMSSPPPGSPPNCIGTMLTNECKREMIVREHSLCDM